MNTSALTARVTGTKHLPPKSAKMVHALRFIGYTFEQAVADLIDNSISAKAPHIYVRLLVTAEGVQAVVIADDGDGMSEARLDEAMTFGSEDDYTDESLGKYGLGLKLASISQGRTVEVLTWQSTMVHGRRWTVDGLAKGWACDVIDGADARRHVGELAPSLAKASHGTVVVWHDLDRLTVGSKGARRSAESLARSLELHLGLTFHRFLEGRKTAITIEYASVNNAFTPVSTPVAAINPFGYPESGHPDYPKVYQVTVPDCGAVKVRASIWPPNSAQREYRLGGRAAKAQGFYFYRRDRLIQAGGWNGVVEHESEAHLSLARLAIDVPSKLDAFFGLSVQKSRVVTPPAFTRAIEESTDDSGLPWLARYRRAANSVYRRDERAVEAHPLVPEEGLPQNLASVAVKVLADGKPRKLRGVQIEWGNISGPDFFELDRDKLVIRLNRNYRRVLLRDRRGSRVDLPLIKTMVFFLVRNELDSNRLSSGQAKRLADLNRLLSEAMRFEGDVE